jgi:hypothetical protein
MARPPFRVAIDLRHYVPAQVKSTIAASALCIRRRPPYSRCNAFGKDILNLIMQVIYETVSRCVRVACLRLSFAEVRLFSFTNSRAIHFAIGIF